MLGMAATGAVATSGFEPSEDVERAERMHGAPGSRRPTEPTPTMPRVSGHWGPRPSRHSRRDTAKGHVQKPHKPEKR